jgi:UDP-N-acetyl-D-mannosaminuronic acid dehydrogenase
MMNKTVCVIGLGYIGLPTAALIANKGLTVAGIDINEDIVSIVNKGESHINETDLSAIVKTAISTGRLKALNKIKPSDVYIICVPTPFHKNDDMPIPQPNIDHILSVTKSIAPMIKSGDLVILESTSPVGTTEIDKKNIN